MLDFKKLKKNSSLDKLTRELDKISSGSRGNSEDDRFWQPEVDKAGNGYAVIRFLDAPFVDGEDALPWVQVFNHGFQGPGGWFIENCPTSIGEKCPACEHNSVLWNSGVEANKEIVSKKQKRRLTYISNILVIKDTHNPENEGKVFLYKFGKKIFDKIKEMIEPQFEDEKAVNVFNFWEGANFKLKIRKVEGYRNYDKCEFDSPSELFDGDDEKLEQLWKNCHSLKEFVAKSQFKSYAELKSKLDRVLSVNGGGSYRATVEEDNEEEAEASDPPFDLSPSATSSEDEDDTMDYFRKLANG